MMEISSNGVASGGGISINDCVDGGGGGEKEGGKNSSNEVAADGLETDE